ncbi:hypothetical protein E1176_07725 [Fulvivirga sp. RKSG066]|uniref:hypothetical protein n=1 Tax=Fulvivirga aurantia TaxID=2529383 RepID=UPI0012BB4D58|nr:hypothetical protein [Fulvivirga aurantia]MTI20906.1 hypothetical protein [Fulvivirga aurantia]
MMINQQLKQLYKNAYGKLVEPLRQKNSLLGYRDKATNPLLIQVDNNYEKADMKIMIFGQETNSWLSEINRGVFCGEIQPVLECYKSFFLSGNCFKYGGSFWNGIKRFKSNLKSEYPNIQFSWIWNNIVKVGKCEKGYPYATHSLTDTLFDVTREEIKILKPDLFIFFTGPNYDSEIRKFLGEFESVVISKFGTRQLSKISNSVLKNAYRTYHPNYLWRKGIHSYLSPILMDLRECFAHKM